MLGADVLAQKYSVPGTAPYYNAVTQPLLYDGHGNTRQLGQITAGNAASISIAQAYDFDAYGDELGWDPGITPPQTDLLYTGEQRDQATGMTYLRARYLDTQTGLFNRLDPFSGSQKDPQSLHKYAYVHNEPVNSWDPNGLFSIAELKLVIGKITSMIGRTLNSFKKTLKKYVKNREWIIYLVIEKGGKIFKPRKISKFGHAYIFAIRKGKTTGLRFDVGSDATGAMTGVGMGLGAAVGGNIMIKPAKKSVLKKSVFAMPVGFLSHKGFKLWATVSLIMPPDLNIMAVAIDGITTPLHSYIFKPLALPIPKQKRINCYAWTFQASVTAATFTLFPL